MEAITPEIARKLLSRDFANLVHRVQNGGKLTRAERAMLQSLASSGSQGPEWVANYVELARCLGVSRRALQTWRKQPGAPEPAASGIHDVGAWRTYIRQAELKSEGLETDEETSLKARKLLAEVEERELRLAIRREEYVPLAEVREEWTTRVGRAIQLFRSKFEVELPPILSGLDAVGIQAECQRALDEVFRMLHEGD